MKNYYQEIIYLALKNGANHSVAKEDLIALTGLSERGVRKQIEIMRKDGYPILSSTGHGGYYLPSSRAECERFINSMESRARKTFVAIQSTKQWLEDHKDMFEQEVLSL